MDIDTESLARRPSLKRLRRSPERFVAGNKDSPATEQGGNIRSKKSRKQKPFERLSQPSDELLGRRVAVSFSFMIGAIFLAYLFTTFGAYPTSCESRHVFEAARSFLPGSYSSSRPNAMLSRSWCHRCRHQSSLVFPAETAIISPGSYNLITVSSSHYDQLLS